jgi:hypothetical protein
MKITLCNCPTLAGTSVQCNINHDGDPVILYGAGADVYFWDNGVSDNDPFTPSTTVTYTVTGTYTATGCFNTDQITVTVNPLPIVTLADFDTICINHAPFDLSGGDPQGGTYYNTTGATVTKFYPSIAGQGIHHITYTYTDASGCSNAATHDVYVDVCTGLAAVNNADFRAMPNPTAGDVLLAWPQEAGIHSIFLFDISGRMLETYNVTGAISHRLDLHAYASGIYFVKFSGNAAMHDLKVVKQK